MKKLPFLLISSLIFSSLIAQEREVPDSLAFFDSPHRPFLLSILQAPVLEGITEPRIILPNDRVLCYDKIVSFKINSPSLQATGCLFIDTENGYMSYIPPKRDRDPACLIKPDDEHFNLTVMGLKGTVYNYSNYRKNNTLQHGVSTGNTETFQHTYTSGPGAVTLRSTAETKAYLGGKIKAHAYKAEEGNEKWFLFGKEFPEKVRFAPKKYLGNFGVGYQQTEEGLFLIMEISGSAYNTQITEIKDEQACFDSRLFKPLEGEFFVEAAESVYRDREKLKKKAEDIAATDYCGALKQRNILFQQEMLARQEENLQQAQLGNLQQNSAAQQGLRQAMYNYEDLIQQQIYETELRICKQEEILSKPANANSPGTVQRIREKINCLEQQQAYQEQIKLEIEKLNTQSPNDPLIIQKKGKLLMDAATKTCN